MRLRVGNGSFRIRWYCERTPQMKHFGLRVSPERDGDALRRRHKLAAHFPGVLRSTNHSSTSSFIEYRFRLRTGKCLASRNGSFTPIGMPKVTSIRSRNGGDRSSVAGVAVRAEQHYSWSGGRRLASLVRTSSVDLHPLLRRHSERQQPSSFPRTCI